MTKKPNVLFIVFDDLTDSLLGYGGHQQAQTPNLDKLAASGVKFTNAHCNSPLCSPSRASMLSGLSPQQAGFYCTVGNSGNPFDLHPVLSKTTTFVEHFKNNGYNVFGGGKLYHNGQERNSDWINTDGRNGYGVKNSWGPFVWDGKEETKTGWNNLSHPDGPRGGTDCVYSRLSRVPFGDEATPERNGWIDYDKDFFKAHDFYYKSEEDRDQLCDEKTADYLSELLEEDHEKPFFMCFGVCRVHTPHTVPDSYFDAFPLEELELPPILENDLDDTISCFTADDADMNTGNWNVERFRSLHRGVEEDALRKWIQAYLASVKFADEQVGKVLDALAASPYAEDTLIVVSCDHGFHLGEKDICFKNTPWEESTRIPFIFAGPGVTAGASCDVPVSNLDLYPSFIDLCGLAEKPHEFNLDGHTLRPLLEDPVAGEKAGPDFVLTAVGSKGEATSADFVEAKNQHWALRNQRYRYILARNGEEELYDRQNDPFEWHNVASQPAYEKVKSKLKAQLLEGIA